MHSDISSTIGSSASPISRSMVGGIPWVVKKQWNRMAQSNWICSSKDSIPRRFQCLDWHWQEWQPQLQGSRIMCKTLLQACVLSTSRQHSFLDSNFRRWYPYFLIQYTINRSESCFSNFRQFKNFLWSNCKSVIDRFF